VLPKLIAANQHGQRSYWGECAVGSVDTIGLKSNAEKQRALVEVRWCGSQFHATPGQPLMHSSNKVFARSYFLVSRKTGTKTNAATSLASAHCSGCGAPEHLTTDNACQFCGTVLNDGAHGWLLEQLHPANSPEGGALRTEFTSDTVVAVSPKSKTQILIGTPLKGGTIHQLAWVVQMCVADGEISEKERHWINQVAAQWKVPREEIDEMLQSALKGAMEIPEPKNREEARSWLEDMARSALTDGYVSHPEEKLLINTGTRYGYAPTDIRLMINQVKSEMYKAARDAIRETKIMRKSEQPKIAP
jgi:hypothetical protein